MRPSARRKVQNGRAGDSQHDRCALVAMVLPVALPADATCTSDDHDYARLTGEIPCR
jgi:hypothetical protein